MLKAGDKIENLTVEKHIKDGTIGSLYKVKDETERTFALKVLIKNLETSEWRMRFEREFEILKRCDHPSIVKVYKHDSVQIDGVRRPYILMDFIQGKDLQVIKEDIFFNLEINNSVRIIRRAAKALEHAHTLSIVHRDIKPGNILVRDKDKEVVVVDFGLAKDFARLNTDLTFMAVGARGYSCAHKTEKPKEATFSDDIWSLGAVLYYLLTGKKPFYADTEYELINLIKRGEYVDVKELNPEVTEEVAKIVRKMLNQGNTAEYQNCRYLLGDLDRLDLFVAEHNKVFTSKNLSKDRLATCQLIINKIYGPLNSNRTAFEIFSRLTYSMGRTNAELMDLVSKEKADVKARENAIDRLTRSFFWLCSLSLKLGVDLESAIWYKFPGVCPYCLDCHPDTSKCSKGTKEPIDIWRLRDIANQKFEIIPQTLRGWEEMFKRIYPATAAQGLEYLSKKLVEELGEVGGELTKPVKRIQLLKETGIDFLAFEMADIFAWMCQVSNALRLPTIAGDESVLANSVASRLKYEICPFCKNPVCVCDLELETEGKKIEYRYLD